MPPSAASSALAPRLQSDTADDIPLAPPGRKLRVLLLSSDTGGGHRASAAALRAAIEEALPGACKVNVVDFWVEFARGPFKQFPEQYAFLAKHPWLWKTTYELTRFPPFRAVTETFFDTFAHERVRRAFIDYAPDLIVSVHPLVNALSLRVLRNLALATGKPRVPYVTVVTDLGGAHPTWFHTDADMTFVPTPAVAEIAARCRVPADRIRTIGLPVRRDFWAPPPSKASLRASRGLADDCPAILLIGGGDGVGKMQSIARVLAQRLHTDAGPRAAQLVIVCGKNESLGNELRRQNWPIPVIILGYVNDMSDWMGAVDVICTKAGPGTIAEALIRGLPMLLHSFLPGQEEQNVQFVLESKVGEYATRPGNIATILSKWITTPQIMVDMAARARSLGAPRASQQIVAHMLHVAANKRARNNMICDNRRRILAADQSIHFLARGQARPLTLPPAQSHLLFHLKVLVRVTVASLITRDVIVPHSTSFLRSPADHRSDSIENALRHSRYSIGFTHL